MVKVGTTFEVQSRLHSLAGKPQYSFPVVSEDGSLILVPVENLKVDMEHLGTPK
jgi:hypothetical protein